MKLAPDELAAIAARTLEHYEQRAESFWEGTRDHDVSQNIAALLRHIEGEPPFAILDLGCGPGRDLKTLRALGHVPVGLEGSARFAAMAREHSGCEVWEQDFLRLTCQRAASTACSPTPCCFTCRGRNCRACCARFARRSRPRGVLFSSNPRGDDSEGWNRGRYGAYLRQETWRDFLAAAGFAEIEHYYRPAGLPREQQPWLATVARAP